MQLEIQKVLGFNGSNLSLLKIMLFVSMQTNYHY